jgi:putative nucleotidyltransferase with HDIG domain
VTGQSPSASADGAPDAAEIALRIKALPPLSTAALKLSQQLAVRQNNAADLERTLRSDPALATNVLRVANSAAYRGAKEVTTLRDAVVRLGRRGLDTAVVTFALRRALPSQLDGYGLSANEFLRHSVAVGTIAERVAARVQFVDSEVVFAAGLLHDIGKLVVSTFLHERGHAADHPPAAAGEASDAASGNGVGAKPVSSWYMTEQSLLGVDHAIVGQEMAMAWRLPQSATIAARWHHQPLLAPDSRARKLAAVIHVADQVDRLLGYGDISEAHVDPEVLVKLGMRESVMAELAEEALEAVEKRCEALGGGEDV